VTHLPSRDPATNPTTLPAALIFDVDGTLAETEEAHRRAFNDTFASAGLVSTRSGEFHIVRPPRDGLQLQPRDRKGGRSRAHEHGSCAPRWIWQRCWPLGGDPRAPGRFYSRLLEQFVEGMDTADLRAARRQLAALGGLSKP